MQSQSSFAVAVDDQRPYVVSREEIADFVGLRQWKSEPRGSTRLEYDLTMRVFDAAGAMPTEGH